jgi:hypothetical protein
MALIAETVVEEYFNYHGFFTIRGLRLGLDEIDILAIRVANKNKIECRHIEVQVSEKPVNYISKFTPELKKELNIESISSAKPRNDEVLKKCVEGWIQKKFTHPLKIKARNKLFPNQNWKYWFVHGKVRDDKELAIMQQHSITTIDIRVMMEELASTYLKRNRTSSTGRDIINLFRLFYEKEIKEQIESSGGIHEERIAPYLDI